MENRTIKLREDTLVHIEATVENANLDSKLWAINWFDLKRPRLYNFYNVLAFPHVRRIGAAPQFKGYVKGIVQGDREMDRQMLLIVAYPDAEAFLRMISNKVFLFKSILRIKSVSRFIFGFTTPIGVVEDPVDKPRKYRGDQRYLAILLGDDVSETTLFTEISELAVSLGMGIHFNGTRAATIAREIKGKKQVQPFFLQGLVLIAADSYDRFDALLGDEKFRSILENTDGKIGIYKLRRVL